MRPRAPRSTLFPYTTLFRSVYTGPEEVKIYALGPGKAGGLQGHLAAFRALRMIHASHPPDRLRPPALPAGELRSEEHTSELQSRGHLVCRLLLEKKKR